MCEYCEHHESIPNTQEDVGYGGSAVIQYDGQADRYGIAVNIIENSVDSEGYDVDVYSGTFIYIEYCPKCGRKLP